MKPHGFYLASALDVGMRGSFWNYNSAARCPNTLPGELATHLLQDEFPEKQNPIQRLKSRHFIKGVCLRSIRSTHERRQQDLTASALQHLPHQYISAYVLLDSVMEYPSLFQPRNSKIVFSYVLSSTLLTNSFWKTRTLGERMLFGVVENILKSLFSLVFISNWDFTCTKQKNVISCGRWLPEISSFTSGCFTHLDLPQISFW